MQPAAPTDSTRALPTTADTLADAWQWEHTWLTLGILAAAWLLGWLLEAIVLTRLRTWAARTTLQADDIVLATLRGLPRLALLVLAGHLLRLWLPLPPNVDLIWGRILTGLLVLTLTIWVARLGRRFLAHRLARHSQLQKSSSIFGTVLQILIFTLGTLVILQSFGVQITALLTALGVGGLAVALALQDTLGNLFAGLHILASRQIHVGDFVRLNSGEEGHVTDIAWRNTTIQTIQNNLIIIPNAELANTIVTNFYQPAQEMTFKVSAGISYASDLDHVERVTLDVARQMQQNDEATVRDYEPVFRYEAFGDSSINFFVLLKVTEYRAQFRVRSEFIKRLHRRFAQEGIEIPFPIRTVIHQTQAVQGNHGAAQAAN